MKSTLRKISIFLLVLMLSTFCLIACGANNITTDTSTNSSSDTETDSSTAPIFYGLDLRADKTSALRQDKINLQAVLVYGETEEPLFEDVEYYIVEGEQHATLDGYVLTIKGTAAHNGIIKVQAREGATISNILEIKVSVPATDLTISANGVTNILAGQNQIIKAEITPQGAENNVVYTITEGAEYAAFDSNVLEVSSTAPTGATIKVKASIGELESNELTFTVGYPLESIVATLAPTNILAGGNAPISVTLTPSNSTNANYTWEFVEGGDYATIVNNIVTVNADAPTGAIVKFKAVCGDVESDVLSFIVGYPMKDIDVTFAATNIVAGFNAPISVTTTPSNTTSVYTWEFIEGGEYATIVNGMVTVNANAPTGTVVKFKAVCGEIESNVFTFTVGYPIESINATFTKPNIEAGDSASISVSTTPSNTTSVYTWEFIEGGEYATIENNIVTVNDNAPTGAVVKFRAVCGKISSKTFTFIVGYPLEALKVAFSATNIIAGESAPISVTLTPSNATNGDYTWEFIEGGDYASVINGMVTVNANAPTGTVVKFKAVAGNISSDELSFTVGYPLSSIIATLVGSSANMEPGTTAQLAAKLNPTNTTNGEYTWEIIEGNDFVTLTTANDATLITIKSETPIGSVVKIVAKSTDGMITSNVLTIEVGTPIESVVLSTDAPAILDRDGTYEFTVAVTPNNASMNALSWIVDEGAQYATFKNGVLHIAKNTPAGTKVTVHVESGEVKSDSFTFTVGIPLNTITLTLNATNVNPGSSCVINYALDPENASDQDVKWIIEKGGEYATLKNGILAVNADAPVGAKVTFYAQVVDVKSEPITITVGIPLEDIKIELNGNKNVNPGASAQIITEFFPTTATNQTITWKFVSGEEYASISGNFITVKEGTPVGTKIKFYAQIGEITSDPIEIIAGTPLESITIELGETNINPGASAQITTTFNPTNATNQTITWVVSDGKDYVSISSTGLITVNKNAPIGETVTFYAMGAVKSNSLTFTIGVPVEEIVIDTINSSSTIVKGNSAALLFEIGPSDATQTTVTWEITEGKEFAEIKGNNLVVNANATTGATIKVVAKAGGITSNELTFTVGATQEEINAVKYMLSLNANNLTIDKYGMKSPVLIAEVTNANFETVLDVSIAYEVVSGGEFISITPDGFNFSFSAQGHGQAVIKVWVAGYENTAETVTIDSIVPPTSVELTGPFAENPKHEYSFSLIDPITKAEESLPFDVLLKGTGSFCQDVLYTFTDENGVSGDSVAVYADGKITFKKTGKINLEVQSNSGSYTEARVRYTFDINEGYNVETFEEFSYVVEHTSHKGTPINLVVLDRVKDYAGYDYGYALVPSIALENAPADQELAHLLRSYTTYNGKSINIRIQAVNSSLYVNGNNTIIDASKVKVFNKQEYDAYVEEYAIPESDRFYNYSAFLSVEAWHKDGIGTTDPNVIGQDYFIKLYDIEVKGNAPIDYNPADHGYPGTSDNQAFVGAFGEGINMGSLAYSCHYSIDVDNLTASAFHNGLKFSSIVGNGNVSNLHVYNCYSTGIVARSSMLTFENLEIGPCGATGIELSQDDYNKAGYNDNEIAKIIFKGNVEALTNLNNGETNYFKNYSIMGASVPQIITGNTQQYSDNQVSHFRNANGEFIFICLLFNNFQTFESNGTIVEYSAFEEGGGIINAANLPTSGIDYEHQFIMMDIYVDIAALGGTTKVGSALFYNHYYGKAPAATEVAE